ncbi:MAG: hypothetical protein Q7R64_03415 [bacterium]|nr:hypothetical protein [bacterium]
MKTKLSLKVAGFLSSGIFIVLLLVPALLYGVGWWFVPKTSPLIVFLMTVVGGLVWIALQIAWIVLIGLSKAGNKPYRPDLEDNYTYSRHPSGAHFHA